MANEYAENIRRIARGDRRRGGLSRQGERDAIEGGSVPLLTNAEIAELNNEQQTPSSNAPENEDKDPEDEEQQDNIDPNDPNSFYRGAQSNTGSQTDEGTYDVGDVIDGTGNAPGSATGSDGSQNSGALRELTGLKDCETDTPFNLHMDGNFIPPEGWEDPETPPELPNYTPDIFWYGGDNTRQQEAFSASPTPQTAYTEIVARIDAYGWFEWEITENLNQVSETRWRFKANFSYIDPVFGTQEFTGITTISINRFSCPYDGALKYADHPCPDEPPTEDSWPEDGTYDLAIRDGQLQTSEFDADKPRDEALGTKPFCFGDGRTGNAHVTADGGLMVYETGENGAPLPEAPAWVYDSAGDFRAVGDATETFINQYLPK